MTQLETIFHEQQRPLMRRLVRMVGDRETAADLCQETFVRAWRKAPRDATPDQHRGWLHTTASHLALDELRRRRLRAHAPLDDALDGGPADNTIERMHAREALDALAPHERLVLLLRFDMGLSHREIGALLDLSEEAARKRVERARASFMTVIRRHHPVEQPLVLFIRGEFPEAPFRRWIETAGGRFKSIDQRDVDRELAIADALVVGASHRDIDPTIYGEPMRFPDATSPVDGEADRRDLRAMRMALHRDLPLVGVCRGHQLLNIALGGTLWQDIEGDGHSRSDHRDGDHSINTGDHSLSRTILGRRAEVASEHHQSIRRLGRGVRVTSATPDGVVEMLEVPSRSFVVGLQWHPERSDVGDAGQRIGDALVHAARRRRVSLSRAA
jgi:putative glutamine amidotransferase